jgi:hypothetical protein
LSDGGSRGGPGGTLIGPSLNLPADRLGQPLREAVALIDRIHGDGPLPTITVERVPLMGREGYYDPRPPFGVAVGVHAKRPRLTMLHEIGHFLDHHGLGGGSTLASGALGDVRLDPWRHAAMGSQAVQELRRRESLRAGTADAAYIAYLLRYPELWARSYAQFVATRGGDPVLMAELDARREPIPGVEYLPRHWDDADFIPIAAEIESLFRGLGWMT